jgi:hypothetical protein
MHLIYISWPYLIVNHQQSRLYRHDSTGPVSPSSLTFIIFASRGRVMDTLPCPFFFLSARGHVVPSSQRLVLSLSRRVVVLS